QLFNGGTTPSSGRLVFHPAGASGQSTDPSMQWSLQAGQVVSYADIVATMGQAGLGSMDLYVESGMPIPIVLTRIYNDAGASGTSGFTEPFVRTSQVPASGSGILLGPSETARFRYNIGVRTLSGSSVTVNAIVRSSSGEIVHTVTNVYPPDFFQ